MTSMMTSTPSRLLDSSTTPSPQIPISSLAPTAPLPHSHLSAVVALLYPYSSATDTLSLLLTEPDFRLRRHRGQIRVQFRGLAARALAATYVGIGDVVRLELRGGEWVEEEVGTPGRGVGGELVFEREVRGTVEREGLVLARVDVDEPAERVGVIEDRKGLSPVRRLAWDEDDGVTHASPAFFRGKRVSSGGFSVAAIDPFAGIDFGGELSPSKRRKVWRLIEKSESPVEETERYAAADQSESQPEEDSRTPSRAPAATRAEVRPSLALTTDLHEQSQKTAVPMFRLPQTPMAAPRPPALQPLQSPSLPMVSPFTALSSPGAVPFGMVSARLESRAQSQQNDDRADRASGDASLETSPRLQSMDKVLSASVDLAAQEREPVTSTVDLTDDLPVQQNGKVKSAGEVQVIPEAEAKSVELGVTEERKPPTNTLTLAEEESSPKIKEGEVTGRQQSGIDSQVEHIASQTAGEREQQEVDAEASKAGVSLQETLYENTSFTSRAPEILTQRASLEDITPDASQSQLSQVSMDNIIVIERSIPMLPTPASTMDGLQRMIENNRVEGADDITTRRGDASTQPRDDEIVEPARAYGTTASVPFELSTPVVTQKTRDAARSDVSQILSPWFSTRRSSRSRARVAQNTQSPLQRKTAGMEAKAQHDHAQLANKVANGIRTRLSYFTPIASLLSLLNAPSQHSKTVDVLAIVTTESSKPQRAKGGPRDYFTTLHVVDSSPASQPVQVQVLRPYKLSLPMAAEGDVILLRNFIVKSLKSECILTSGEASAWCVWRLQRLDNDYDSFQATASHDEDTSNPNLSQIAAMEEIKGPPVEVEDEERLQVFELQRWWTANQAEASDQIEHP